MAVDLAQIIPPLVRAKVDFIPVGGMAAILHGSARVTFDVDLVYSRGDENIRRLADALAPHKPYLRGAPAGLPFEWNAKTVRSGLNFTLTTALGDTYQDLLPHSCEVEAFGVSFIRIKEAAGRPKDREAVAELRVLLEERQKEEV
jgi:hypothetical protein